MQVNGNLGASSQDGEDLRWPANAQRVAQAQVGDSVVAAARSNASTSFAIAKKKARGLQDMPTDILRRIVYFLDGPAEPRDPFQVLPAPPRHKDLSALQRCSRKFFAFVEGNTFLGGHAGNRYLHMRRNKGDLKLAFDASGHMVRQAKRSRYIRFTPIMFTAPAYRRDLNALLARVEQLDRLVIGKEVKFQSWDGSGQETYRGRISQQDTLLQQKAEESALALALPPDWAAWKDVCTHESIHRLTSLHVVDGSGNLEQWARLIRQQCNLINLKIDRDSGARLFSKFPVCSTFFFSALSHNTNLRVLKVQNLFIDPSGQHAISFWHAIAQLTRLEELDIIANKFSYMPADELSTSLNELRNLRILWHGRNWWQSAALSEMRTFVCHHGALRQVFWRHPACDRASCNKHNCVSDHRPGHIENDLNSFAFSRDARKDIQFCLF